MHNVSYLIQLEKELLRNEISRKLANKNKRGLPIYIRNVENLCECIIERNLAIYKMMHSQELVELLPEAILIT